MKFEPQTAIEHGWCYIINTCRLGVSKIFCSRQMYVLSTTVWIFWNCILMRTNGNVCFSVVTVSREVVLRFVLVPQPCWKEFVTDPTREEIWWKRRIEINGKRTSAVALAFGCFLSYYTSFPLRKTGERHRIVVIVYYELISSAGPVYGRKIITTKTCTHDYSFPHSKPSAGF